MNYTIARQPKEKRIAGSLHAIDGRFLARAKLFCRKAPENHRRWEGTFRVEGKFNASDFLGRWEFQIRRPNRRPLSIIAGTVDLTRRVNEAVSLTGEFVGRDAPPRSIFG
jgi:hypothetical protein